MIRESFIIYEYLSDFRIALYVLAIFRVTMLFSKDNGPWDVFDFIRHKLGVVLTSDLKGNSWYESDKFLGRIIICTKCLSFYVLLFITPLYVFPNVIVDRIVYFLGVWGLLYLIFSFVEGKKEPCQERLLQED